MHVRIGMRKRFCYAVPPSIIPKLCTQYSIYTCNHGRISLLMSKKREYPSLELSSGMGIEFN